MLHSLPVILSLIGGTTEFLARTLQRSSKQCLRTLTLLVTSAPLTRFRSCGRRQTSTL